MPVKKGRPETTHSYKRSGQIISDAQIEEWLMELVSGEEHIYGYVMLTECLRSQYDLVINKKKTYRLCKKLGILQPQRRKKTHYPRRLARNADVTASNQQWQLDIKYGYVAGYDWLYLPTVVLIPVLAGVLYDYPLEMISNELLDNTIMFVIGVCFRMMISAHLKMKEMMRTIQHQNHTLEMYAGQIEKLTITEERNRIAGELHDTVGHTFTSTILGMEAVCLLMDKAPEQAKEQLKQLAEYARVGFEDARRHIHQIAVQEDEPSLAERLSRISDEFGEYTGTRVSMEVSGEEPLAAASESVKIAFIRCLQETLTNAKRHGHATEIRVQLAFRPESVALTVTDNGSGAENLSGGFGITSMNNRVASLNGTLEISSKAGAGTRVVCTIPLKAG